MAVDMEANKRNDLLKLVAMRDIIEKYENSSIISILQDTLIGIGELAGGEKRVSFNDDDKESFYIRNKFGYIQRNKKNHINADGIYFEKLYHLKIIFEVQNYESSGESSNLTSEVSNFLKDFDSKRDKLEKDLANLKQKIEFILNKECEFISMKTDELAQKVKALNITEVANPSTSSLIEFSTKHYEQLVLRRIAKELKEFTAVDFKVREDRYYFARVFTIIGEFLHEFNESKTIDTNVLPSAFKTLDQIRSQLLHYHRTIKFGAGNEKNETEINEIIGKLIEILRSVIKEDENKIMIVDSNKTKNASELNRNSKSLLNIIEGKPTKVNDIKKTIIVKPRKIKEILIELDDGVYEAHLEFTKNPNLKEDTKRLQRLNRKYQPKLEQLDAPEKENYPKSLSIDQKDEIITFQNEKEKKKLENQDRLKMLKIQQKTEKAEVTEDEKEKTRYELKFLILSFQSKEKNSKASLDQQNKKYQSKLLMLSAEEKEKYPKE